MFQYYCLNPIAQVGLDGFGADYKKTEDIKEADGVLVRSAAMHDMELPEKLLAVAEQVQVSIISRLINVRKKVSSYSIHPVQMPMV